MTHIEQMIQDLCPQGVEFKKLGEVTYWDKRFNEVERSMQPQIRKYHYYFASELEDLESPTGTIKILYTSNKIAYAEEETVAENVVDAEVVAIPWGGNANIKYFKGKFVTADNRIAVVRDTSILSTKFVYYWLKQNQEEIDSYYRGAGIKHPSMLKVLSFEIPIPPMEVQKRIVTVLDAYSALAAELQAELHLRRKQYEYYRTHLLTPHSDGNSADKSDDCNWVTKPLSEIAELKAGIHISAEHIFAEQDDEHPYPCFGGNGIRGYVANYSHKGEYPIIGRQGALCGCINYAQGKFYATEHAVVVKAKANNNPRYLFHMLTFADLNQYKSQGAQPGLAVGNLNVLDFSIPSIREQKRIADLLDKFEALTTSLSDGIPAEQAAQQKRYEYYRDLLLTFPRKEV